LKKALFIEKEQRRVKSRSVIQKSLTGLQRVNEQFPCFAEGDTIFPVAAVMRLSAYFPGPAHAFEFCCC
jgi:hypothetical protein